VGKEEYNIDNIRYHKIVIMTDADVDGSHIRTLLLTFFYRQMSEIIDRGYLYIAQPPLFRVGKGRNAVYLKDDGEFNDYVLKRICDRRKLEIGGSQETLFDHELYLFLGDLSEYHNTMGRLENRGIGSGLVEMLIKQGVADIRFMQDKDRMMTLKADIDPDSYDVSDLTWNEERSIYQLVIRPVLEDNGDSFTTGQNGHNLKPVKIGRGLIYSKDYQKSLLLHQKIDRFDKPPFILREKDKDDEGVVIDNKQRLLEYVIEEGKKGLGIQRYKGLGEMNPEQLWETTMNPEKRTLLRVGIEDVVDTDEIFTVLMGEDVEPRRDFIQSNALEVNMLDI
jgi:DNA gyrase subunit B